VGDIRLLEEQMVQDDDDVRRFDGRQIVNFRLRDLERRHDRRSSSLGAEGRRHDHTRIAGTECGAGHNLGRRDRALAAASVPADGNKFFVHVKTS